MKKLINLVIAGILLVILSIGVSALQVTRSFSPSNQVNPGTSVTVSLAVNVGTDDHYIIEERVPSGLTVTSASDSGDYTTTPGKIFWIVLTSAGDKTYTYLLSSVSQGTYNFPGVYMGPSLSAKVSIGGQTQLTVGTGGTATCDISTCGEWSNVTNSCGTRTCSDSDCTGADISKTCGGTSYIWFIVGVIVLIVIMLVMKKK